MVDIETLSQVLGEAYRLIDYDDFWQVVRPNGEHVALVLPDLTVQIDLSVIILPEDEDQMYDLAEQADALLRESITAEFEEAGFGIAEEGSIQAAEAENGSMVVYSYELPTVTRAEDPPMVLDVLEWADARQREFILFGLGLPLVPAEPLLAEDDVPEEEPED